MPVIGSLPAPPLHSGDVLSLRVSTRVGTNPDGSKCPGHTNAVGLRLYYDAINRPSRANLVFSPDPLATFYLHGASPSLFVDSAAPTASVAKTLDSAAIHYAGGNPWRPIGVWSMTR
jgi:hypothetical protein